jgi:hypothetical protein
MLKNKPTKELPEKCRAQINWQQSRIKSNEIEGKSAKFAGNGASIGVLIK